MEEFNVVNVHNVKLLLLRFLLKVKFNFEHDKTPVKENYIESFFPFNFLPVYNGSKLYKTLSNIFALR